MWTCRAQLDCTWEVGLGAAGFVAGAAEGPRGAGVTVLRLWATTSQTPHLTVRPIHHLYELSHPEDAGGGGRTGEGGARKGEGRRKEERSMDKMKYRLDGGETSKDVKRRTEEREERQHKKGEDVKEWVHLQERQTTTQFCLFFHIFQKDVLKKTLKVPKIKIFSHK